MRGIAERIQGMIDTGDLPFPMFTLCVALLLIELLLLDDRSITSCFSLFLSFHPFAFSKTFQSIPFSFGESSRTLIDGPTRRRHADHHNATAFLRPKSPRLASVVDVGGIITRITFNAVSWRKESVESLDERRMGMKQGRDAVDYARGIDGLAFEFLHDVEETVVDVGLVRELDLKRRGVSMGSDVTRSVSPELARNRHYACPSRQTTVSTATTTSRDRSPPRIALILLTTHLDLIQITQRIPHIQRSLPRALLLRLLRLLTLLDRSLDRRLLGRHGGVLYSWRRGQEDLQPTTVIIIITRPTGRPSAFASA
jgi:hypothetical protein